MCIRDSFYNDFMALVPLQLPQLIDVTTMEKPQFYGDYVLLTFPLRDSYDLEAVSYTHLVEGKHRKGGEHRQHDAPACLRG